jgi:hypothetical protein
MLDLETRLEPNSREVAAQVIDGEAILINLSSGVYYSMNRSGSDAWVLISGGQKLGDVGRALAERYSLSPEGACKDVLTLAEELLREDLVHTSPGAIPGGGAPDLPVRDQATYDRPQLNVYRDMGDLLALDPPMPSLQDIPWKPPAEK